MNVCTVDGCADPARARGWCWKHYQRARSNGDPLMKRSGGPRRQDVVDHHAMHQRLRRNRGPAKRHTCRCGAPARQWAYIGPRAPGERMPVSQSMDDYEPMCVSCHKTMDMHQIREAG